MTIPMNGTAKSATLSVKEVWARLRASLEAPRTNNGIEKNKVNQVIGLTKLFIRMKDRLTLFRGGHSSSLPASLIVSA
jgi:hypothetical protein